MRKRKKYLFERFRQRFDGLSAQSVCLYTANSERFAQPSAIEFTAAGTEFFTHRQNQDDGKSAGKKAVRQFQRAFEMFRVRYLNDEKIPFLIVYILRRELFLHAHAVEGIETG